MLSLHNNAKTNRICEISNDQTGSKIRLVFTYHYVILSSKKKQNKNF